MRVLKTFYYWNKSIGSGSSINLVTFSTSKSAFAVFKFATYHISDSDKYDWYDRINASLEHHILSGDSARYIDSNIKFIEATLTNSSLNLTNIYSDTYYYGIEGVIYEVD